MNVLAPLPVAYDDKLKQILDTTIPKRQETFPSLKVAHETFIRSILTSPTQASGCYMTAPGFMCRSGNGSFIPPDPSTEKHFTMAIHLAHPLSRGSVHITSSAASFRPLVSPSIQTSFLTTSTWKFLPDTFSWRRKSQ
jgi:hypothetical protein